MMPYSPPPTPKTGLARALEVVVYVIALAAWCAIFLRGIVMMIQAALS